MNKMGSRYKGQRENGVDRELASVCKAVFLANFDEIEDTIDSKKKLISLMQQTGRNPSKTKMNKYWPENMDQMSFDDFVDTCNKEPVTKPDDLMNAFRKIDVNGDGYLSLEELYKIMNKDGGKMSRDEVKDMMDEVDENKDGKLDYKEFTNMMMKTTEDSVNMSMKMMERKEKKKRREERRRAAAKQAETVTETLEREARVKGSEDEMGSKQSLKETDRRRGSVTSLKSTSDKMGSVSSLRRIENDSGSRVSLKGSEQEMGSRSTLKGSEKGMGSRISVKEPDIDMGSRSTLKAMEKEMGSKSTLKGLDKEMGSRSTLKGSEKYMGSSSTLNGDRKEMRSRSQVSLQSVAREDSLTKNAPDDLNDAARQRPSSASSQRSQKSEEPSKSVTTKASESPKGDKKTDSARKSEPQESERATKSDLQVAVPAFSSLGKNSARSVKEEIDYDDDFDIVSTGRPTPRIELASTKGSARDLRTDKLGSAREGKDGSVSGSRTSLRSGEPDMLGVPVPSPRKSVPRALEDDGPRPSPRIRASKTKSPSTKGKDRLPDPKSLRDWQHLTSKGCFFYEEDEIVSHVYSLKIYETSTVYLSAHPIQEPECLKLPSTEPVDTAIFVFDDRGKLVTFTEQRDVEGTFGVQCDLKAGTYQVLPYTTGCRFKQRSDMQDHVKEARLVKKDKDGNVTITPNFKQALKDIFQLCDLDNNGFMSHDEFNWFNLRTSGEELGDDEWEVVEERTQLSENNEITLKGFIELNEMEAEDAKGDVEDLWITLSSMGMNKALIMDEACPYQVDVFVEHSRKNPEFRVTGIESTEKKEFVSEICQTVMEKAGEPTKIKGMKDLYQYTYRNEFWATVVVDNRSRSTVNLNLDCSRSRNVISNRSQLDHSLEVDPQDTVIAHHLLPRSELSDWSIACTETIQK